MAHATTCAQFAVFISVLAQVYGEAMLKINATVVQPASLDMQCPVAYHSLHFYGVYPNVAPCLCKTACHPFYGFCRSQCKTGFTKSLHGICVVSGSSPQRLMGVPVFKRFYRQRYRWGESCDQFCFSETPCNRTTGGVKDEQQCLPGYGFGVDEEYPSLCTQLNCQPSYVQNNHHCAHCPDGFYGDKCFHQCKDLTIPGGDRHCSRCDQSTGACSLPCEPGYMGEQCQEPCDPGTWGRGGAITCPRTCNCEGGECYGNGSCNAENCRSGRTGYMCRKVCSAGTWGPNCVYHCMCENATDVCHVETGRCDSSRRLDNGTGYLRASMADASPLEYLWMKEDHTVWIQVPRDCLNTRFGSAGTVDFYRMEKKNKNDTNSTWTIFSEIPISKTLKVNSLYFRKYIDSDDFMLRISPCEIINGVVRQGIPGPLGVRYRLDAPTNDNLWEKFKHDEEQQLPATAAQHHSSYTGTILAVSLTVAVVFVIAATLLWSKRKCGKKFGASFTWRKEQEDKVKLHENL